LKEVDPCTATTTYSSAVTVTGSAKYTRREFESSYLGATGTAKAIRFAEIRVTDAVGSVVQCSQTDSSGDFSFQLPLNNQTYLVSVNSRGLNSSLKASVLNNPTDNQFYSLSTSVVADQDRSVGTLTAEGDSADVLGGAFNILDVIVRANEFLRDKVGSCSGYTGCAAFTVADKVSVFWGKGVNPATYVGGSASTGLSFYLPGRSQLYILGGIGGDVDNTDTDHFDDSVIAHEYGHFIEDLYAETDSPGGAHDANSIIDPRLAWGEGWANFFSLAVNGSSTYRDSFGNVSGTSRGYYFNHNLENTTRDYNSGGTSGEGNFREFAVTRALWDLMDAPADASFPGMSNEASGPPTGNNLYTPSLEDGVQGNFAELWAIFSNSFKSSTYAFRDYGLFMYLYSNFNSPSLTGMAGIYTAEKQKNTRADYAAGYTLSGTDCGSVSISSTVPSGSSGYGSAAAAANQFYRNDFYLVDHPGGVMSLALSWTGGQDLDLYVYGEGYTYGSSSSVVAKSDRVNGTVTPPVDYSESVSQAIAAGKYLVNVNLWSGSGTASYKLQLGGQYVCP